MYTCCSLTVCFYQPGNFFKVIKRCIKWKSMESYHPSDFRLIQMLAHFHLEFHVLCWSEPCSECDCTMCVCALNARSLTAKRSMFMFAVRFIIVCISFSNEEKRLHFLSGCIYIFFIVIFQYLFLHKFALFSLAISFACSLLYMYQQLHTY